MLTNESNFPDLFEFDFNEFQQHMHIAFVRLPNVGKSKNAMNNVYIIDKRIKKPVKYKFKEQEEYQHYKQMFGGGYATLIRNSNNQKYAPFRMVNIFF